MSHQVAGGDARVGLTVPAGAGAEGQADAVPPEPIRQVAEELMRLSAADPVPPVSGGPDGDGARAVASAWLSDLEPRDLAERSPEELARLIHAHLRLGARRAGGVGLVDLFTPNEERDGWSDRSRTVLCLVTDDRPFIVDTVAMTLTEQGWSIHQLLHPQLAVRRDRDGVLCGLAQRVSDAIDADRTGESWILAEITPPLGEGPDLLTDPLRSAVEDALSQVVRVTDDYPGMQAALLAAREALTAAPEDSRKRSALDLLDWLAADNFTLLGYHEYVLDDHRYLPVAGTGLGVLAGDADDPERFDAVPIFERPNPLVITKDSRRAGVHRPAWMDYVGVRLFDADGAVVGERRFLGLFSAEAYTDSVWEIPLVRDKAAEIIRRSGHLPGSHSVGQLRDIIATYPRDELLHARVEDLFPAMVSIAHLRERRRLRLFVRTGYWGRFVSCLVYFPRDRYSTEVRHRMMTLLGDAFDAETIEYQARVSESVLARLFFTVRVRSGQPVAEIDLGDLERRLAAVTRSWDDEFIDLVGDLSSSRRGIEFTEGYKGDYPPAEGVADLASLNEIENPHDIRFRARIPSSPEDTSDLRIKMFRVGAAMELSEIMPHLTALGLDVVDERPNDVVLRGQPAVVYDFGVRLPPDAPQVVPADARRFTEAFLASYDGLVPADEFTGLLALTGLDWRQVALLRTLAAYLRQLGTPYSPAYMARALGAHPQIATWLVELFETRFRPGLDAEFRQGQEARIAGAIVAALDGVESLDHDRIVRQMLQVVQASDRTNWFAADEPLRTEATALAVKLRPRDIDLAPEPRPLHEIFVAGPLVEGTHLRFGRVARGGLRWSDRPEDFRTEILGLAKAQMVKNSVIVPAGAKGGFVPRRQPAGRAERQAAGVAAYRSFIRALLSVTDSLDAQQTVRPPEGVVRHDDDDPYLVVAADKGTATFSDLANEIAVEEGFWLGDAFASGGSEGYDHKAMGITARGAWESVKRHFHDLGMDCQRGDFTCVGIGDMSGDVFGNGMLLSEHTRLVAAFNHLHIFLDPDPDPVASFAERRRLFDLPRSTWDDYDRSALSPGGGVYPRTAKSIPVTPQVRRALGLGDADALSPTEFIRAILCAPVDLLWNGGVGTYVRASTETDAEVGDRSNDALRVEARQVRARVAGEGGNLGWTQEARIEYARLGGRINTDFIDNSAGVDTSDHEVNIKILLAAEVAAGRMTMQERNELLPTMADEVASLVLAHNIDQNAALSDALPGAVGSAGVYEMWMERLEQAGYLDRRLDALPSPDRMAERIDAGEGLTNPELATLLSWTKIWLADQVLASDLPEDPFVADRLITYFPRALQDRFREQMPAHPLRREIITTVAVNRYVHSQGIVAYHRRSEVTGAAPADVIRAQLAARSVFGAGRIEVAAQRADLPAAVRTRVRAEVRHVVDHASRILLRSGAPLDIRSTIDRYEPGVRALDGQLPRLLDSVAGRVVRELEGWLVERGVAPQLAERVALLPALHEVLSMRDIAEQCHRPVPDVAAVWFELIERLGLRGLRSRIDALPRDTRWTIMARAAAQDDEYSIAEQLVSAACRPPEVPASAAVDAFEARRPEFGRTLELLRQVGDSPDLAALSVALRSLRALAEADRA